MTEVISVNGAAMLEAINRSEVDMQVVTAHKFPRSIDKCKENIVALAAMDDTIAYNCFYHLERTDKDGQKSVIEGPSIRFAEIIAACWTNLRLAQRIVGNDGVTVTAQGVCHDLETNVAVSMETKRSIVNKYGKTFSQDMQVVTGNAAAAIALRNAICKVVPTVLIKSCVDAIKAKALEHIQQIGVSESWKNCVAWFQTLGVTDVMLLSFLGKKTAAEVTNDDIMKLGGVYNAIKEGTTTVDETFRKPKQQAVASQAAKDAAQEAKAKAQEAMNRSAKK